MDIEDLTIKQARELAGIFGDSTNKTESILSSAKGKHVIVRSRNEGINFGLLEEADDTGCVLSDARRVWYHKPANSKTAWYEGVATTGLDSSSKVSCEVAKKFIIEDYSITICTNDAVNSIKAHPSHES